MNQQSKEYGGYGMSKYIGDMVSSFTVESWKTLLESLFDCYGKRFLEDEETGDQ